MTYLGYPNRQVKCSTSSMTTGDCQGDDDIAGHMSICLLLAEECFILVLVVWNVLVSAVAFFCPS